MTFHREFIIPSLSILQVFPSGSDALRIGRKIMFVPEYNNMGGGRVEQGIHHPRKRVAWKKLRKERKKFSKLLIFSTDCSQPMGLQSVIKIRGKTSKLFALHASPYKGTVFTSDPECLRKERPAAVFNFKKKQIIVFRA